MDASFVAYVSPVMSVGAVSSFEWSSQRKNCVAYGVTEPVRLNALGSSHKHPGRALS